MVSTAFRVLWAEDRLAGAPIASRAFRRAASIGASREVWPLALSARGGIGGIFDGLNGESGDDQ